MAVQRSTISNMAANDIYLRAIFVFLSFVAVSEGQVPCTNDFGWSQKCHTEFTNAAFNAAVTATNTCGETEEMKYCSAEGDGSCDYCNANVESQAHPAEHLVDSSDRTWWQSETLLELNRQQTQNVNLTIHLGKAFEINYIRIKFQSIRPESFVIYKRTTQDGPWIPYQFYSGSCKSTYGLPVGGFISRADETKALCTRQYSDLYPLTGGNVAFTALEGRPSAGPSAYDVDSSEVLQEWVTATDILVVLTRLNTFGDEVLGVADVLRSYYYAVADFVISGRCKCNGHASECVQYSGTDSSQRLQCNCQHNTMGQDCSECLPGFNDRQWRRATVNKANECKPCHCNGKSETCFFDKDLYDRKGSGSHCTECRENTDGTNCEKCMDNYFRATPEDPCRPTTVEELVDMVETAYTAPKRMSEDIGTTLEYLTEIVTSMITDEPQHTATGVDECDSGPCQHDGLCTVGSNGYTCECQKEWTGTNCQIPREKIGISPGKNTVGEEDTSL